MSLQISAWNMVSLPLTCLQSAQMILIHIYTSASDTANVPYVADQERFITGTRLEWETTGTDMMIRETGKSVYAAHTIRLPIRRA